jgi:Ca-activated chloride channel homolog
MFIKNKIVVYSYRLLLATCFLILATHTHAQEEKSTFTKRVLFILDGSGSMNERWHGQSKWDMAVQTLSNLIDSFEQNNKDFEIAIRVLGHQYPRNLARCDDTKLEIDFTNDLNFEKVNTVLKRISPKGMTPLAYSISQAELDFKNDIKAQNIVILITDGLENCEGNPCEVAEKLRAKNIFINPYIIGLGIDSLESQKLECIGKFIDAKNKTVFREVIKTIFTEVARKTTLTIQLIQSDSTAYLHYVPFSLVDKRTKRDIHSYIYTSTSKRYLDTIQVNPQYQYDLIIHSNPTYRYDGFEIIKGTHQHYIIPVISGNIEYETPDRASRNLYFLREKNLDLTHWHQGIQPLIFIQNSQLTTETIQNPQVLSPYFNIKENSIKTISRKSKGTFILKKPASMMATIYNSNWDKILTIDDDILNTIELITGDYFILYNDKNAASENSKIQSIKINENLTTQLLIQ